MRTAVCIIARMASSRLPAKVMQPVNGHPLVENIILNMKRSLQPDTGMVLCTTELEEDSPLEEIGKRNGLPVVRGSVLSVSDRMLEAARITGADIVVRVTGDNIFTDVVYLDALIEEHIRHTAEYSRVGNLPNGVTAEVMNAGALERCYSRHDKNTSEYMTLHMFDPEMFRTLVIHAEEKLARTTVNLSVDTPQDMERTLAIFSCAKDPYDLREVLECVDRNSLPGAFIDETKMVKLIDKEMSYLEFKKFLQGLEGKSIQIVHKNGWYAQKLAQYGN